MKPIHFKNANASLAGGPKDDFGTAEDVADLPVYRGGGEVISRWQPSLLDRLRLAFGGGSVWVRVWGANHPPLSVEARHPFV